MRDISDAVDKFWKPFQKMQPGKWIEGWFKKRSSKAAPVEYSNYEGLASDPLAGSSASTQNASFGGGGTETGGLGKTGGEVANWALGHAFKGDMFATGFRHGFLAGGESTLDFLTTLGTAQGWKALGQGFVDLGLLGNQFSSEGMMMRAQMAQSMTNYLTNIPNMTVYEVGHDLGFGTEKVVESLVLTRGAGLGANAIKSGVGLGIGNTRILSNTTIRGTTLFKRGKNFRIDFDYKNYLHYHRRGPGGIGRHRPWQVKPGDKGDFWKRF